MHHLCREAGFVTITRMPVPGEIGTRLTVNKVPAPSSYNAVADPLRPQSLLSSQQSQPRSFPRSSYFPSSLSSRRLRCAPTIRATRIASSRAQRMSRFGKRPRSLCLCRRACFVSRQASFRWNVQLTYFSCCPSRRVCSTSTCLPGSIPSGTLYLVRVNHPDGEHHTFHRFCSFASPAVCLALEPHIDDSFRPAHP